MININLLPWRENLRRRRRRKKFLGIGLVMGLFLGIAVMGHWVVEGKSEFLQQQVNALHSSLRLVKREREELELVLGREEKILRVLRQQRGWREGFACHQRWLRDLGVQLPGECLVETVKVNSERGHLVVVCGRDVEMKNLIHAVSSLRGWSQVGVRQLDAEEKAGLVRVEFNALMLCR